MTANLHSGSDPMREIFFALCKAIDTPVSLGAWLRYKYSHTELASMEVTPGDYRNATAFHLDYVAASYLKKYKGLRTGLDLEQEAIQRFTSSENQCAESNRRIRNKAIAPKGRLATYLHVAQRKISKLLGPFTRFKLDGTYGWGPGATREIPRRRAFIDTKMCEVPISVTRSAKSFLASEIESDLHWSETLLGRRPDGPCCLNWNVVLSIVESCKVTTVAKDAKTNRTIAIEPRGNGFLQKGFGDYIRKRLRTVGIDLDNQELNQAGARCAYDLGLATLDLKAASDTVCLEIVYDLLPYEWAAAMDAVRSRWVEMPDGLVKRLEKFSSMGNGFTFELESLIFWALASAVVDTQQPGGQVLVYGDDLIVPAGCATDLCLLLQYCGFTVNDQKSFISGPFYESCGEHYFQGQLVTPAYQKELIIDPVERMICGNRLIRLAARIGGWGHLDSRIRNAWEQARRDSPIDAAIPLGPDGDDGWLLPSKVFPHEVRHLTYVGARKRSRLTPKGLIELLNHGIRCRVVKRQQREFVANELALFAWSLRRGVKTEIPYLGQIRTNSEHSRLVSSSRYIVPGAHFALDWK